MADTTMPLTDEQHEQCGRALFNAVWALLEKHDRTEDDDEMMVHTCHAMYLHWSKVGKPPNFARAEWQLARVYSVLERPEPALRHARRCLEICQEHGIGAFDRAFAHEALARAHATAGNTDEVGQHLKLAEEAGQAIKDAEDRELLFSDLKTVAAHP
ncbi:MAG: tetratricopeptide repeat protein [Planctomycetota bacterium]|jgi:hypothetical protein